jgi:hypothetical protein
MSPQYQTFLKTGKCSNDGYIPAITLTINGHAKSINDGRQVLNGGGEDRDICTKTSEFANWVKLGPLTGAATHSAMRSGDLGRHRSRHRLHHHAR